LGNAVPKICRLVLRAELNHSRPNVRNRDAAAKLIRQTLRGEKADQLFLDCRTDLRPLRTAGWQSFQNQPLDVDIHLHATLPTLHATLLTRPAARNSSSLITRPNLRSSVRADSMISGMVMGTPWCAA
jgi:hypothetical protein